MAEKRVNFSFSMMFQFGIILIWIFAGRLLAMGHESHPVSPANVSMVSPQSGIVFRGHFSFSLDLLGEAMALIERSSAGTNGGPMGNISCKEAVQAINTFKKTAKIQCPRSRYYTIDGTCNNLEHPEWGSAFTPFIRELANKYDDGKARPRIHADPECIFDHTKVLLPSARLVSTECVPVVKNETEQELHPNHNQNLMQFGQFFSHDLGLSPVMDGVNCCDPNIPDPAKHPHIFDGGPCFPIDIPPGDRQFNRCMFFNRTIHNKEGGIAEQINAATHLIDQSPVYGSTEKFANSIREFTKGKLKTDKFGMLPQHGNQKCLLKEPLKKCPVGGDNRLSEFPGLTCTHLLWYMEHNRLADKLGELHPDWDDELLFQTARALVIAQTQNMVYKEYLPIILGPFVMKFFDLNKPTHYNNSVNPSVINSFQTAAFRFGHSQINNIFHFNNKPTFVDTTFFRPFHLFDNVTYKPIYEDLFLSLTRNPGQHFDATFASGIVDTMFLDVDAPGRSSDLVARNTQRGRDHGLPPYMDFLDKTLKEFKDTNFIRSIKLPTCINNVYRSLRDLDLFIGGVHEVPVKGGVVGPVFAYLIGKQFKISREGDRLFFDSIGSHAGFTQAQIRNIKSTSYAGIVCRNFNYTETYRSAFKMPDSRGNPKVKCTDLPDIDFSLW